MAFSTDSKSTSGISKKEKRGVAFFGPAGYDLYGVVPGFGTGWASTGFGPAPWDSSLSSDLALGQIQLQATHNIALQVHIVLFLIKAKITQLQILFIVFKIKEEWN